MEKIKELRDKTGAGISDCKKALDESGGDIEKAVEILRKKGIAKAAKRGDRDASEGVIKMKVSDDRKTGFMIKLSSETDFVSKNEKFQDLGDSILNKAVTEAPQDLEALLALDMDGVTVKDAVSTLSGVIGEKIELSDYAMLNASGTVASYSHMGGKIGVLVALDKAESDNLAFDTAMQIAAAAPKYLVPEDVPQEELDKEIEVYKEQLLKEGKPEEIIEKILPGKLNKYYQEICLMKQEFIKDDKKKMEDVLGDAKIEKYERFSLS